MKQIFFLVLVLYSFFEHSLCTTPSDVTCSQIDFLFYDSQCCDSSNSVQCLKQLSKLQYDSTIDNLQDQINRIVSNDELAVSGGNKKLSIESGADIEIVSDTTANPSQIIVKEKSSLVMEADSILDLSAISLQAGQTNDVRAVIDNIQLSNVQGKNDVITMDDPLHADKGIVVDGDRFTVEDFSGNVESKGNLKVWGNINSASLDINDKLKVSTDGTVTSKGSVEIANSLIIKDGVVAKFTASTDGRVEALGLVEARNGLEVRGSTAKLMSGINTNNVFTVDPVEGDTVVKGSFTATKGAILGGTGTNTRLQGTTTVGAADVLVVEGTLSVVGQLTGSTMVATQTINVNTIDSDVDFNDKEISKVKVTANSLDGPVGSITPSTIVATTIGTSGLATLDSLSVTGDAALGNIAVVNDELSGAVSITSGTLASTGDAAVGGNAAVTGTLGVTGATTLAATTAASVEVTGAATLKGAVSMEGDVTFEKKMIVNEELQIGTGVSTPASVVLNPESKKCSATYDLANDVGGFVGLMCNDALPAFDGDTYADSDACLLASANNCAAFLAARSGSVCVDGTTVTASTDSDACIVATHTWKAIGIADGVNTISLGVSKFDQKCKLCKPDSVGTNNANHEHGQPFYGFVPAATSGAVDFAKDGTLKTSGKATLASMEVVGDSAVVDLASSGIVTINTLQTSDDTKFKVDSSGDVVTNDVVVGGTLAVNSGTALSSTLTVVGATIIKNELKTQDVTNVANPVDGVILGTDGSIEAKSIHIDGIIVGKDEEFKVDGLGEVTATRIHAAGYFMPMFQESIAPVCRVTNGLIMFAEGSCSKKFRKYTCTSGIFNNQAAQAEVMGQCPGTVEVESIMAGATDACVDGTTASTFCEELKTRQQCEGIVDVSFKDDIVQTLPSKDIDDAPLTLTWTPVGTVVNRLCMSGYEKNLVPLPVGS